MSLLAAYALPHPPILLPAVAQGRELEIARTSQAYAEIARRISALKPDVLVIVSPHATLYADYFHLSPGEQASGTLAQFSAPGVTLQTEYDAELVKRIEKIARQWELPAGTMGERAPALDHGTMIPLFFLRQAGVTCKVVRIGLSGLPTLSHYHLGQCVTEAVDALNRRAVFIASGDLSHKLTATAPYGFAPEGAVFDKQITDALAAANFGELLTVPVYLAEAAAECGLRSLQIMAGALDQKAVRQELLSYEGPFGVGYCVAAFEVTGENTERAFGKQYEHMRKRTLRAIKEHEDVYVNLARRSLEAYVRYGTRLPLPEGLPPELLHIRAGVFVSLKKDGQLRGCIGTTAPTADCIAMEIMRNAISAASHDPRFEPVREDELEDLVYSVDVLGDAERVHSCDELDPKRYGVIVQNGSRRGLLLPALDGVDTPQQQIDIAKQKAGIKETEKAHLSRFEVVRHH